MEINELFAAILPGLLAAQVVVILLAARLGFKERKRLNYTTAQGKGISDESIQEMLKAVRDKDPELKRPKLFVFNLLLTLAALVLLIQGEIHGSIIFMLGSAIALVVNYRDVKLCSDRLEDLAPDVLPTAIITMGAGVFSGVLSGSGMANALANTIASLIPTSLSTHMAPVYAVIAAPAICFLPQDAFYFGIASVLKDVMGQFGITPASVRGGVHGRPVLPAGKPRDPRPVYALRGDQDELRGLPKRVYDQLRLGGTHCLSGCIWAHGDASLLAYGTMKWTAASSCPPT